MIIRTGRRIPGVPPLAGVHHPISVVRMAVEDAYGAEEGRAGEDGDEVAFRTERVHRSVCRAVAEYAFATAERMHARVYGGPKWTVSPVYEGMLKEEMDAAAARHSDVPYQPQLIDVTFAGLVGGAGADAPLVIPALNRDGDSLSELVLRLFGSIAGAESVLLAFDEDYRTRVVMTEAPHGTAPALEGKNLANPMAMILAVAALLRYLGDGGVRGRLRGFQGDLRGGAGGDRLRHPDSGPRWARHHVGVHRRGHRARADQARDLVDARWLSRTTVRSRGSPPAAWSWRSSAQARERRSCSPTASRRPAAM